MKRQLPKDEQMIAATAWFARLAVALSKCDYKVVVESQAALERLGVIVKFVNIRLRMLRELDREGETVRDQVRAHPTIFTWREREVLKLRYGLEDGYIYTLEEVARIFKVTKGRIRSLEAKALKKLRERIGSPATDATLPTLGELQVEREKAIRESADIVEKAEVCESTTGKVRVD